MNSVRPTKLWLSGRVMRWHTHPRMAGTGDRLDGHHARVAQIILEKHPSPSVALLRAALTHDAGEMDVGDIPSRMKRDMPDVAERHARVEAVARDSIAGPYPNLSEEDATWLRFADRLDAYLFAQHMGMDMTATEWRLAHEEIARLEAMLVASSMSDAEAQVDELQARIAELEAKLTTAKEALMRISQGGNGVLLTSYPPQDPTVNLAKRILAELEGDTG